MPLAVILDTNFFTVPAQFGVDIFAEAERILERKIRFVILSTALDELEHRLAHPKNKTEERHFRIARNLVSRCEVIGSDGLPQAKNVDDQLLRYTKDVQGVLATNDRMLRRKARKAGIPVIFLRGKKHLALEGSVM